MKKFFKIALLTAVIVMVLGVILVIAAVLMLGDKHNPHMNEARVPVKSNYYFDFDEVVFYDLHTSPYNKRRHEKGESIKDSLGINLIHYFGPENLSDTISVAYLDSIGAKKIIVPQVKHAALKEIFREKTFETDYGEAICAPIFRDIYVLRKKGEITGIVKICYECGTEYFLGTDADTYGFGNNKEYEQLNEIVRK